MNPLAAYEHSVVKVQVTAAEDVSGWIDYRTYVLVCQATRQ